MVHDHFEPLVPLQPWQPLPQLPNVWPQGGTFTLPAVPVSREELDALRAEVARLTMVVNDFIAAKNAAETVDRLTAQPDCVDPDKSRLIKRVADLEKRLAAVRDAIGT
jgi:hypothetical protein